MKITPEIEAVARALCWANGMNPDLTLGGDGKNFLWHEYERQAIAAIRALREPTEKQIDEERRALSMQDAGYGIKYGKTYTAMIDAALGENK